MTELPHIQVSVPLQLAAALERARYILTIAPDGAGGDGYITTRFDAGFGQQPLPNAVAAELLRQQAQRHVDADKTQSSPVTEQGIATPGAAAHVDAPGVVPTTP